MPIVLRKEAEAGWATATLTGEVPYTEIRGFVESLFADAEMCGLDILWDIRAGTIASLTAEGLDRLNTLADERKQDGDLPPARAAVVAPRDVDFGIARMQQVLSGKLGVDVRVFRNLAAAEEWLRA